MILICLLHYNELYFRRLFCLHDIGFSSGDSFRGPIGKMFQGGLKLDLVPKKFIQIKTCLIKIPKSAYDALNRDAKYLYDIVFILDSGVVDEKFLKRKPGKVVQSRWVTLASNLCRLILQTPNPTHELIRLVTIVVQIYVVMYFEIKMKPHYTNAARHFFKSIELARNCLDEEEFTEFKISANINSFSAHPELIFVAAFNYSEKSLEKRAIVYDYIMKDRQRRANREMPIGKKIILNNKI